MKEKTKKRITVSIGCVLSLLFILLIFSPDNVNPLNPTWTVNGGGDNLQHYLGWRFFRNAPWNRYLLFMRNLNYPIGTSVIVTDSNPLLCLIFKLFRNVLPAEFQFNGIWLVLIFVLIGLFSAEIGWKITQNPLLTISGVILAILNPVILQRSLIHDTLTAHWLILAGIWLAMNDEKRWNAAGWVVLAFLTLLIHIYFVPMLAFILVLQLIHMLTQKRSVWNNLYPVLGFAAALLAGYYALGYDKILPQSGSYGELSMNLNAFINPDSISSLLKPRARNTLQYEGFNYFGLGMIGLLICGTCFLRKNTIKKILPYLAPVAALIILAASNQGYFDKKLIYNIPLPERIYSLLSVFRSSGRLVWPLYYLLLFGVLALQVKYIRRGGRQWIVYLLTLVCTATQIIDLNGFHRATAERFRNPENRITQISSDFADVIPENVIHLFSSDGDSKDVDALALFAADHSLTFNISANARGIQPVYGGDKLEMDELNCEMLQLDSVYVYLSPEKVPERLESCSNAVIREIDGWMVILSDSSR